MATLKICILEHMQQKCQSWQEMNYHVAKKHAPLSSKQSTVCASYEKEFPSFYSLEQHRRKKHGAKPRKPSDTMPDLNKIVEEGREAGEKFEEEFSACQYFLVDTDMENGRHKVFNFQMSKLDTKVSNEKLEEVFNKLDSAAKINIALCLFLRICRNGKYWYYYEHDKTTLCSQIAFTAPKAVLITMQEKVEKLSWSNALKNFKTQSGGST